MAEIITFVTDRQTDGQLLSYINHHHDDQGVPGIIYWRGEEAVTNYLLMAPAAQVLLA